MVSESIAICLVCTMPLKDCICCPECGHVCSLDQGEPYCPVCLPDPRTAAFSGASGTELDAAA